MHLHKNEILILLCCRHSVSYSFPYHHCHEHVANIYKKYCKLIAWWFSELYSKVVGWQCWCVESTNWNDIYCLLLSTIVHYTVYYNLMFVLRCKLWWWRCKITQLKLNEESQMIYWEYLCALYGQIVSPPTVTDTFHLQPVTRQCHLLLQI